MKENDIAKDVVDICIHIHKKLGPGLLESAYESILAYSLIQKGYHVERNVTIPLTWEGLVIGEAYRADIIVNQCVILELKATEKNNPVFARQLMTYLKISGLQLGLLINFGSCMMKNGIERVVNGLEEASES